MAFHLGCLRALNDIGLLDRVGVLSTISGGSVVGAYFAYTPQLSFEEFEFNLRRLLYSGFQRRIVLEFLKPNNLLPCLVSFAASKLEESARLAGRKPRLRRYPSRTDMFSAVLSREIFAGLKLNSPRRNNVEVVIGACELRTGSAFRFGNRASGDWRHGQVMSSDFDVAFAVAASAAYPLFLPPLDRTWLFRKGGKDERHRVILADGGVYDNLGIQVLEPGRDPAVSLHTFECDYLIVCNAGMGQEAGTVLPVGFLTRVGRSFQIIHRRVQDSSMHRLHHMKDAGLIKGFALPYLGQQDERLPWKPANLVRRNDVIQYPTNFASMDEEWVERISGRGEQLTRLLVSTYLPELLD